MTFEEAQQTFGAWYASRFSEMVYRYPHEGSETDFIGRVMRRNVVLQDMMLRFKSENQDLVGSFKYPLGFSGLGALFYQRGGTKQFDRWLYRGEEYALNQ